MVKIALAEDNGFLADSLIKKLGLYDDFQVKFHAYDGQELLDLLAKDANVHIVLMDIQMPGMNGVEATKAVNDRYPNIKVIMLTVLDDEQSIYEAIQAGAVGYLLKESSPEDIRKAVVEAVEGGASMSPSVAMKAMKMIQQPDSIQQEEVDFKLSPREVDVLKQLSKGLNYRQIAVNLFISPNTVRRHTENIYQKLKVHNKAEALQVAYRYRLV